MAYYYGTIYFVLGLGTVYYQGFDYAVITDFKQQQADKIQLSGKINDYDFIESNWLGSNTKDTIIFPKGSFDIIAILQDASGTAFNPYVDVVYVA